MRNILDELKKVSAKRVLILVSLFLFVVVIVYLSILSNVTETVAYSPFNAGRFSNILKGQNLDEILNYEYSDISAKDKELAYIYLLRKLKTKNLNFVLYKIKRGENFWQVAKKFHVNIDTIIGANPELKSLISKENQEIIVLSKPGVIHEIKDKEESFDLLSKLYKVDKGKIIKANDIKGKFKIGDVLFIPEAKPVYISEELANLYKKRSMFRSPLCGVYTCLFGKRIHPITHEPQFHDAVDIGAKIGTWVGASAAGTVVYAGWLNNLGYCVKIAHKDGYTTLYGHLSKIYVKTGQKVKQGQLIAKTGNTGRTTGPHLHFAIYKNGKPENPLKYLW